MPLVFNGTTIPELGGSVNFNGTAINVVNFNGTIVWRRYVGPNSPLIITATRTIVGGTDVPAGIPLTLCMCGGGGSGGCSDHFNATGGGHAGAVVSQAIAALTVGQSVTVTIGSGGAAVTASNSNGNAGTASSYGTITAAGGARGDLGATQYEHSGYHGRGASRTTCGGTYNDGTAYLDPYWNGGQAGAFGKGGNAYSNANGQAGGVGAGGGCTMNDFSGTSGAGGRGQVNISW